MAYAYKKGERKDVSPEVKQLADSMSLEQLHDFAATKTDELPKKATAEDSRFKGDTEQVSEADLMQLEQFVQAAEKNVDDKTVHAMQKAASFMKQVGLI